MMLVVVFWLVGWMMVTLVMMVVINDGGLI